MHHHHVTLPVTWRTAPVPHATSSVYKVAAVCLFPKSVTAMLIVGTVLMKVAFSAPTTHVVV